MKSYLSLTPISAKIHHRQNRTTLFCIIFTVFTVTAVFNMAEIGTEMEQARLVERHDGLSVSVSFNSTMGQTLPLSIGTMFLLILFAGILMTSNSLNSSVA